ncbi:MAG: acetyltransferase [Legionellaceae bacterium]|nr:acetyltransferase [Legionellaceae bacterium]
METLAILGASGHGKVIADAALASGWGRILFFDDAWPQVNCLGPWPVIGATKQLIERQSEFDAVIIAIGDNRTRFYKAQVLRKLGIVFALIIHPRSVISPYAKIGAGSVVFAGAVLNPGSVLGEHCIVNTNATIEHDCILGDAVHVSPGANLAGCVEVGVRTWIGVGSNVKQLIKIAPDVVVGAGAVVVHDVSTKLVVGGVPAKPIMKREEASA